MNSLRTRLLAGTAIVAVVPFAVSIALLSYRVGAGVRHDASARLDGSLQSIVANLRRDQGLLDARLALLARDPTLRRLYLVQGGERERLEYLEDRRALLGLDFLSTDAAPHARTSIVLESAAPIVYDGREVGVVRGGYALDSPYLARLKTSSGVGLTLRAPSGVIAASTDSSTDRGAITRSSRLDMVTPAGAVITAVVGTDAADRAIREFQVAAFVFGLLGLAIAVALASAWSTQISRPVEELAAFARKVARGEWSDPLTLRSVRELETLVAALETMRGDLAAYRERLVTSERQAAWSLMARKVAHEVKNPLTPIAVSVADLKRSYEQQRPDFPAVLDQAVRTISEEVAALKRLLQEFSDFARLPAPRLAPCAVAALLADVGALYASDVARGRLRVVAPAGSTTMLADAEQLRQVLINLIQNAFDAMGAAGAVTLSAEADAVAGSVELVVADEGPGLSEEERAQLFVPGFTTKAHGSGLGLTIAQRIVLDHGGSISIDSARRRGTTIRVRVPLAPEA